MLNRLVAENHIKTPFKGQTFFSLAKKTLAYSIQSAIVVKSLLKQCQLHIPLKDNILSFQLSLCQDYLIVLQSNKLLTIYKLEIEDNQIKSKIFHQLEGIIEFKMLLEGFVTMTDQYILNYFHYSTLKTENIVYQCEKSSTLVKSMNQSIFIRTQSNILMLSQSSSLKFQNSAKIQLKEDPIAIYQNRFLFQKTNKQVQIYDLAQKKIIGKFDLEQQVKQCLIRQNIMLIIVNKDNTDYFWFYVLKTKTNTDEALIRSRYCYQKGKADFYNFINIHKEQYSAFIDNKSKQNSLKNDYPNEASQNTVSIVFALYRQKQKVEVIKVQHNKIIDSNFQEIKLNKEASCIILNKIIEQQSINKPKSSHQNKKQKHQQNFFAQKAQINKSLQHKSSKEKFDDVQKKYIQRIIDFKLNGVIKKFQQLQKKVQNLETSINKIYQKMEEQIKNIKKLQIKNNIEALFLQLNPQFQQYFTEVFRQVSCVLEQGSSYYNYKLAKQAELHKEALARIVNLSFKATEDMIELSKKELKLSEKTQANLKQLAKLKKSWCEETQVYQTKMKEMKHCPFGKASQGQGKVFIKAQLNSFEKRGDP